jgi:hypothetical protein
MAEKLPLDDEAAAELQNRLAHQIVNQIVNDRLAAGGTMSHVSMSCPAMRTRLPDFRTLPSSTYRTPSSRPTCLTSMALPL